MMAGAAVMALYALGFVAAAGAVALALVLPAWAANPDRGCRVRRASPARSP